jgi:ATP-binding cassette, subfamily C, type I secretion system permease/ATPase
MQLSASKTPAKGSSLANSEPLRLATDRVKVALRYSSMLSAGINILSLTSSIYMMQLFDRVMTGRHEETLVLLTAIALAAYVAFGFLDWSRNQIMSRAGAWAERQLAGATIVAGLRMTLVGQPVGAQGIRDLAQVRQVVGGRALFAFLDLPWALIFFAILFALNIWLGIYAMISAAIIAGLAIIGERSARALQRRNGDRQAEVGRWVDQAVGQAEAVHALGMRSNLLARHRSKMIESHGEGEQTAARIESFAAAARAARQIAQLGIMALAAFLLLQGKLSPGLVIAGSILLARALSPIDILISSWQQIVGGWAAYSRLRILLEAADGSDAARTEPPAPDAELTVVGVHKRLPDSVSGYLLRNIGFSLTGGQALGVLGDSGSGKTSLCRVLTGISVPEIGEIRLAGARLDQWPPDGLGVHLGYLPQDVGLPPATVAETIARLAPTPDMDEVYRAAEAADAHALIMRLPQGYDTPIGAGGVPLSGGQRQRIGLARALFGDPVLLVLDEPDAHLDAEGSRALARTVDSAKARGAIVVLVSHRLVMLRSVDQIIVLKEGRVADLGPRDEVLSKLRRRDEDQKPAIVWTPPEGLNP